MPIIVKAKVGPGTYEFPDLLAESKGGLSTYYSYRAPKIMQDSFVPKGGDANFSRSITGGFKSCIFTNNE